MYPAKIEAVIPPEQAPIKLTDSWPVIAWIASTASSSAATYSSRPQSRSSGEGLRQLTANS